MTLTITAKILQCVIGLSLGALITYFIIKIAKFINGLAIYCGDRKQRIIRDYYVIEKAKRSKE